MVYGIVLVVTGFALIIAGAVWRSPQWTVPLVAGGVAAVLLGVYQRWWTRQTFNRGPRRPSPSG